MSGFLKLSVLWLLGLVVVGCDSVVYAPASPPSSTDSIIYTAQPARIIRPPVVQPSPQPVAQPATQPTIAPATKHQPTPPSLVPQPDAPAGVAPLPPQPVEQDEPEKHPSGHVSQLPDLS